MTGLRTLGCLRMEGMIPWAISAPRVVQSLAAGNATRTGALMEVEGLCSRDWNRLPT
jgi:hypothetical protein